VTYLWTDEKGIKFDHLWKTDIATIETVSVFFFTFKFDKSMKQADISSVLLWMSQHESPNGGEVLDFIQWMWDRGIRFKLGWRWNGKGLIPNIKTFFFIQGLRLKMLISNIRRMINHE
jgi:hypothetical protein